MPTREGKKQRSLLREGEIWLGTRLWPSANAATRRRLVLVLAVPMFLLVILVCQNLYSRIAWAYHHMRCTTREMGVVWKEGPAHDMHRTCPAPSYDTLQSSTTDHTGSHPHICITTLTNKKSQKPWWSKCRDFDNVDDQTWPGRQEYARRHNYTLLDGSVWLDASRPPAWSKIRAVQAAMGVWPQRLGKTTTTTNHMRPCDWVFWMDADTVIMNMSIPLESFIPSRDEPDIHLVVTYDKVFGGNSGAWFLRRSEWSKQFLEEWWESTDVIRYGLSLSGDNKAFGQMLNKKTNIPSLLSPSIRKTLQGPVRFVARCNFNSFGVFLKESVLKAVDPADKEEWMKEQIWYMSEDFYHAGDFVAHASAVDKKSQVIDYLLERVSA